jgi:hypothetical protein
MVHYDELVALANTSAKTKSKKDNKRMSPIVKAFFVTVAVAALNRWLEPIVDQQANIISF